MLVPFSKHTHILESILSSLQDKEKSKKVKEKEERREKRPKLDFQGDF